MTAKTGSKPAAGVFTQSYATQLVIAAVEEATMNGLVDGSQITIEKLEAFLSRNGRRFYGLLEPAGNRKIVLEKKGEKVTDHVSSADGSLFMKNSRAGSRIHSLRWHS